MKKLYFDLETTGPDTEEDRIIQIGVIITDEDGNVEMSKQTYLNPEIPIKPDATAVHGISDADVIDKPTFAKFAKGLKAIFEDKIIVGYNSMAFDIPLLLAEFNRAGVEVNLSGKFLDVFKIEKQLAPRTLAATYEKYMGKPLVSAHDAMADIMATKEILEAQALKIQNYLNNGDAMGETVPHFEDYIYEVSGTNNLVDFYGKFNRDAEGWLTFKFGQHLGKRIIDETKYADWMLNSKFPAQVKKLICEDRARLLKEQYKKQ